MSDRVMEERERRTTPAIIMALAERPELQGYEPTILSGTLRLKGAGLSIWHQQPQYGHKEAVLVRGAGALGRKDTRRFHRLEAGHLAGEILRIIWERKREDEARAQRQQLSAERRVREEEASRDIEALITPINERARTEQAPHVDGWEVEEVNDDGVRTYDYELKLSHLSGLQVRAVLAFLSEAEGREL